MPVHNRNIFEKSHWGPQIFLNFGTQSSRYALSIFSRSTLPRGGVRRLPWVGSSPVADFRCGGPLHILSVRNDADIGVIPVRFCHGEDGQHRAVVEVAFPGAVSEEPSGADVGRGEVARLQSRGFDGGRKACAKAHGCVAAWVVGRPGRSKLGDRCRGRPHRKLRGGARHHPVGTRPTDPFSRYCAPKALSYSFNNSPAPNCLPSVPRSLPPKIAAIVALR
jgi:hypothetical protein